MAKAVAGSACTVLVSVVPGVQAELGRYSMRVNVISVRHSSFRVYVSRTVFPQRINQSRTCVGVVRIHSSHTGHPVLMCHAIPCKFLIGPQDLALCNMFCSASFHSPVR